jgi:F0F1-type ATP synthase membrane subunit b/b'
VFTVFVVITVVGFSFGIILLVMWYMAYRSTTSVAKRIRDRLKDEISEKITDDDSVKPSE